MRWSEEWKNVVIRELTTTSSGLPRRVARIVLASGTRPPHVRWSCSGRARGSSDKASRHRARRPGSSFYIDAAGELNASHR